MNAKREEILADIKFGSVMRTGKMMDDKENRIISEIALFVQAFLIGFLIGVVLNE